MPAPLIANFSRRLPPSAADDAHWARFKRAIYGELIEAIREIDRVFGQEPYARVERLRELRREHHLIVVADRIRRHGGGPGDLSGDELRKAAAAVLDRSNHLVASGSKPARPRSHAEDNMLTSARVNWHKLMRRAGSRAELRGGWSMSPSGLRGVTAVLRKIRNPLLDPEQRGDILREHVQARLKQLAALAADVMSSAECSLSAESKQLVDEVAALVRRFGAVESAQRSRDRKPPLGGRQHNGN